VEHEERPFRHKELRKMFEHIIGLKRKGEAEKRVQRPVQSPSVLKEGNRTDENTATLRKLPTVLSHEPLHLRQSFITKHPTTTFLCFPQNVVIELVEWPVCGYIAGTGFVWR
jgi:hypothetical protein